MTTGATGAPVESTNEHLEDQEHSVDETTGAGNIDKIRDILFGARMRDFEARFLRLEERLTKESDEIKTEIRNRTTALEGLVRDEVQVLSDRFKVEREERREAIGSALAQTNESIRSVERKNTQLDDKTAESQRDIRRQIFEHSNNLSEQIRHQHEELARLVEQRFGELRNSKADRTTLAGFLAELATRLASPMEEHKTEGP
jgi:uncharacterized protein YydD (DUF2326 family)